MKRRTDEEISALLYATMLTSGHSTAVLRA